MADGEDRKGCSPQVMAAMITAAGAITVAVITVQNKAPPAPAPMPTVTPDPIGTPEPFVPSPSPTPAPSPTLATAGPQLLVQNHCHLPVNLWIVYEGPNGLEYSGYGNWTYQPGESSFAAYGTQNLRPINANILFYAESTDGSINWAGDRSMDFNGRTLAMRKADISTDGGGNYVMELNCSSS